MRTTLPLALTACALVLGTGSAAAQERQERNRVGLAAGYPAAVGLVWHVSDRFALRPDVSITRTTSSSVLGPDSQNETSGWSVGVGLSGLIYVASWDDLRAYVSPRFAYDWSRSHIEQPAWNGRHTTTVRGLSLSGSFGADYRLSERCSLYFEAGLGYADQRHRGAYYTYSDGTILSVRSAIGGVFYF